MKTAYWIFLLILSVSCKESKNDRTTRLLSEWTGKKITFPDNIAFSFFGKDTVNLLNTDYDYAIVSYVNSTGCINCNLQLEIWNDFLKKKDLMFKKKVELLFFLHPINRRKMVDLLKEHKFTYPVCIDMNDQFRRLNNLEDDLSFQTFLLNSENVIVAIGNPVHNPKVKELYQQIILGDEAPNKEEKIQTTVACSNTIHDLGKFNWKQEQQAHFTLDNTGSSPLVITDVITSCGCTSVKYNKEPVRPGNSVDLAVHYKADHPEHFNKTINVYCNAATSPIKLEIKGRAE